MRDLNGNPLERGDVVADKAHTFGVVHGFSCERNVVRVVWDGREGYHDARADELVAIGAQARDRDGVILYRGDTVRCDPGIVDPRGGDLGMLVDLNLQMGTGIVRTMRADLSVRLGRLRLVDREEAQRRLDAVAQIVADMITATDDEEPDIDHEYTSHPVCPWCGYELRDLCDYGSTIYTEDDTEIECGNCERTFRSTCSISYTFSTVRVDLEAEKRERERVAAEEAREHAELRALAGKYPPGTRVRVRSRQFRGRPFYAPRIEGRVGTIANVEIGRDGRLAIDLDEHEECEGCKLIAFRLKHVDPRDIEVER